MKIAIVGAGLSGLACAYEFVRSGIVPKVFEKKSLVGKDYMFSNITLRLLDKNYRTSLNYLNKKYNLNLKAHSDIHELIMKGPKKSAVERGNLGQMLMRGNEKDSLENQFLERMSLPVEFDTFVDIREIKNIYDYVICATGEETTAKELGVWSESFNVITRVANIIGNFKTDSVTMWTNTEYSKACYAFLTPHDSISGRLLLCVNQITFDEMEYYWDKFLKDEGITYKISEIKDLQYNIGIVEKAKVDNVFLVGNSGGFIDDFLGFGAVNAIESGILAARSIINNQDYDKLIIPIKKYVASLHEFRKVLNEFDNKQLDRLISFLGLPLIKKTIYNNPFLRLKSIVFMTRLY